MQMKSLVWLFRFGAACCIAALALPRDGFGQARLSEQSQPLAQPQVTPKPLPIFRTAPAGRLKDDFGYPGKDNTLYAPGMRFPIDAPTTLNSQVLNPGGQLAGSQCSPSNYNEEWWDTFCEKRDGRNRNSLNCTSREIHQGIDMRGGTVDTCRQLSQGQRDNVRIVAVYDGVIDAIGSYTVQLKTELGVFKYLHLNMESLPFSKRDLPYPVKAGQTVGFMSNDFGGAATTFHLHLEHHLPIAGKGIVPVPLYCDLVLAYERDRGKAHVMADGSPRCDGSASPQLPTTSNAMAEVAMATPPPVAPAGTVSFWRHNGSEMRLVAEGDRRQFVYETPREGLTG
jgi:hypothetical protein